MSLHGFRHAQLETRIERNTMFKQLVASIAMCLSLAAQSMVPQTGTWVVTSELDGRPGRGMAIDVQDNMVVMQMYAYESSGQPTFYLGVGTLQNDRASLSLTRYTGGRYFGSGAQSGVAAGSPGTAMLRFTSGISGFVTFPGEQEKAISRFNFAYPATAASLRGIWSFVSFGPQGIVTDVVRLSVLQSSTSSGNGVMATADGTFGCEQQVHGELAGGVLCVRIDSRGQLLRGHLFVYSVNAGEGRPLTASGSVMNDHSLVVNRLATSADMGTGIVLKDAESPADPAMLRQHIAELAATVVGSLR